MRRPTLKYDRGTLTLHPPPRGKKWLDFATWDDRIEKYRVLGLHYRPLIETLQGENIDFSDEAKAFTPLELTASFDRQPYPHQTEALMAWKKAGRRGVVVLPTASGKTFLAQMAMECTPRTTLIIVPTIDLLHQWYAQMLASFPDLEIGLLGGGSRDNTPILIATYNSAAIHSETIGNRYALLIFDECHHLPADFFRKVAEDSIAPYRLGLTATPDRADGSHEDLDRLIGPVIYRKKPEDLSGKALAEHETVQIRVKLSDRERQRYQEAIALRNAFLQRNRLNLSGLDGWQNFVMISARSSEGRRAMLAHREAKEISSGTEGKLRVLAELICEHYPEPILIFTNDNATVYRISRDFLIPAITHQTPVKERHEILTRFRTGEYKTLVASHVLNEGVDVPEARIAIILSGTGSAREYIQRLGRILRKGKAENKLAILYEVIAENTSEEKTSERRRGKDKKTATYQTGDRQLELLPSPEKRPHNLPRVAESSGEWKVEGEEGDRD
jgi:superfamily II DNA or RNA helicase